MFITLPVSIDFKRWVSAIKVDLSPHILVPDENGEENWRQWALSITVQNNLNTLPIPIEVLYPNKEDWRQWAFQVISLN